VGDPAALSAGRGHLSPCPRGTDEARVRNRRIVRELAIAGVVGGLFAASPLTGAHLGPKALAGLAVGGGVLAYRWRSGALDAASDAEASASLRGAVPLAVWAAGLAWLVLFFPTLRWLWHLWTASVWVNNHGIFMPAVIAFLAHLALRDDPSEAPESSPLGFLWLVPAFALAAADGALRTGYLGALAMIGSLPGLALLLLGARRTRLLAVPLALGLLMVPVPNVIATDIGLRQLTASGVEPTLHALGVSALRHGTVIQLAGGGNTFVVANACSGVSTLYASVATAIVLACYARSHARRLALLLAVAPLAIAANVLRVVALILMSSEIGKWIMDSPLHPATGVATFGVVLAGLLLVAGRDPLRVDG
jgi:exosortase